MALGALTIAAVVGHYFAFSAASPLDDVGAVLQNSPISDAPDLEESGDALLIARGIGSAPAPESPFLHPRVDPVPRPGLLACDRDYASPCPENFAVVPMPAVGGGSVCVAGPEYSG